MPNTFENHTFETTLECSYVLHIPDGLSDGAVAVVTLHGYGSNPEDMLRLTIPVVGREHVIASVRAPNQYYVGEPGYQAPAGYNWGIRQHWQAATAVHQAMVQRVLSDCRADLGWGRTSPY